jgi:hypothetical protein
MICPRPGYLNKTDIIFRTRGFPLRAEMLSPSRSARPLTSISWLQIPVALQIGSILKRVFLKDNCFYKAGKAIRAFFWLSAPRFHGEGTALRGFSLTKV